MKRVVIILCCLLSVCTAYAQTKIKGKNIIIIYCDDMGYGDLGITGNPGIKTPNIDGMALEGARFTNYYSASPACTASRYSLLTGRYPVRSGFRWVLSPDAEEGIRPEEQTLAEVLKKSGYKTAIFGKWHLGSTKADYLPLQNGFDEYLGLPYSNDMIPPKYPSIALLKGNDTLEMNPDQTKLTALYSEHAIDFIERNKQHPFFLYLPYAMPHTPLHPGKRFVGTSARGLYGDAVQEIDFYVGRILETLKQLKLDKNTLVWFTSDNGPWLLQKQDGGSAGLFRDGKGSTWEGGMRVPCIVWGGGFFQPNTVDNRLINAMDVYATTIRLAGTELPPDRAIDGRDLSAWFTGEKEVYSPERPFFYYGIDNRLMAVRMGKWKLHVATYSQLGADDYLGKVPLLFNLEEDPGERYELSATYPEIVTALENIILEQKREIEP